MSNLEKYLDKMIEQRPASLEGTLDSTLPRKGLPGTPMESGGESMSNLLLGVLRRWYIVLLIFFVMCAIGLPMIWLLIEPLYGVTGAIRVAPILPSVLTGQPDRGEISNYQNYVNTQAIMITSNQVMQRVADDLVDKDLRFFKGELPDPALKMKRRIISPKEKPDPVTILKQAKSDGIIGAGAARGTELIRVTMKTMNPEEAKQIVDAFIRNYMAVYVSGSVEEEDQQLTVLENERRVLTEKLKNQHRTIRQLADEYGTTSLDGRQDMMLRRVTTLLGELTRLEAQRINLEANTEFLEQTEQDFIPLAQLLSARNEHVNSDPTIQELTRSIVQIERDLVVAKQRFAPNNPVINQKRELLDAFKSRLEQERERLEKEFDELISEKTDRAAEDKLHSRKTEIEAIKVHEKRLREVLTEQDEKTIELGRKHLNISDLQFQMQLDQELYDAVCRRIQVLEMERKKPARISVAYYADVSGIRDKRAKYSAALVFGSLFCGVMLAYLRDKADKSVRTPNDVARKIGIKIIGTTASSQTVKPALFPEQISGDYQTIRANLGLLDSQGMPKKVVITSAGIKEGKTTFSVNLATSLARSGKKVLLVDGDLRKPDIVYLLNLPKNSAKLQDVLSGREPEEAICSIASSGLDVLASRTDHSVDVYELLSSSMAAQQIDKLSQRYDHLIIDAPPVLAFPDALLWAKIAGSVILASFAGRTTTPDFKETLERLAGIDVRVLGTVLSNVRVDHGYYRYGYYNYYSQNRHSVKANRTAKTKLLLPLRSKDEQKNDVKTKH